VRDRSCALGRTVGAISRTPSRRTGEALEQVLVLNQQAGRIVARSAQEARRLAMQARASTRGRSGRGKLQAAAAARAAR
jgi:hypothetical protein